MAWFEVDIFKRCVEVDLHDYSHKTAITAARQKIKEAYDHGFRYIRLIHGSANIIIKNDGGSIKFGLRSMLKSGELARWVDENGRHKVSESSITIELRPNPSPIDNDDWNELPGYEY